MIFSESCLGAVFARLYGFLLVDSVVERLLAKKPDSSDNRGGGGEPRKVSVGRPPSRESELCIPANQDLVFGIETMSQSGDECS